MDASNSSQLEFISWQDLNIVQTLRNKGAEFLKAYNNLISIGPQIKKHPELVSEYNDLMTRGASLKSKVTTVLTQVEGAIKTFKSIIPGMSAVNIVPAIIPVAIIVGAIALLGKWITDYMAFNRKLQQVQELTQKGIAPERAVAIVSKAAETPGILGHLISPNIGWLLFGGIALFIITSMRK